MCQRAQGGDKRSTRGAKPPAGTAGCLHPSIPSNTHCPAGTGSAEPAHYSIPAPESELAMTRAACGAAAGQGGLLPARRGWGAAAVPQTPGVPVGRTDALSVSPAAPQFPNASRSLTHLPHRRLPQAGQGLAGPGGHRLPAGHQLGREVAGGREGAGQCLSAGMQDQPAACPQPLPGLGICGNTGREVSPPAVSPKIPPASRPPHAPAPRHRYHWRKGRVWPVVGPGSPARPWRMRDRGKGFGVLRL